MHMQKHRRNFFFRYEPFINFLTSVRRHEERDTILKSLSYHTMLSTPLKFGTSRGVFTFSTPWSDPNFSTPWSDSNFSTSWSDPNFICLPQWQRTRLSANMVQSQLPTASFLKSSNSQDHHFRAWRNLHSRPFPIWG